MRPEGERPLEKVIGENIEMYYLESDYNSVTAFANDIGLDSVQVRRIMTGERSVSVQKLQHIAYQLNVKTIDLIEDWSTD
jgi:transcriptional regulator with XRE-family HTH domain